MSVIYALRTTVGREEGVLEKLDIVINKNGYKIKAILLPKEIKGYILVEAENVTEIENAISGINHIRGIVRQLIKVEEIKHFLESKPAKIQMEKGDVIEIVSGPFKGEKAKITRIDTSKREVTIEFLESAVAIPVTVALEAVRVIQHLNVSDPNKMLDDSPDAKRDGRDR